MLSIVDCPEAPSSAKERPSMATTFVGVWRAGNDAHYLWQGVHWTDFQAKWDELSGDGLRLTDVTTDVEGGQRKWAGIFRAGTDAHFLWRAPDLENFLGQWNMLSQNEQRLASLATLDGPCSAKALAERPAIYARH
jgi:hypothetical protein